MHSRHLALRKTKSTCFYIQYTVLGYVSRACTVLFYDKLEIDLVCVLSCSLAGVGRFGNERNVDLCNAARRAKAGKEAIPKLSRKLR